ncbi:MAG TPA: polymorphic toxin type 37 domain-containing protein, partial [Tissierellaceae bacterium]|nr:polymorphic toxin type 37 domain-containing protein [Tissierellaceae bacterium]
EYSYDNQDRLIKAVVTTDDKVTTETYLYDYAGRRIAKSTDGKVVNYLVDTSGLLSHVLAEYDEDDNLIVYYTRGDDLISQERDGQKHYYLYDGHNSVRMLVDENSNITDTYTYDAFGNLTDRTGTTENNYLYCGEQFNGTTGLYYLRARYMNPSTGTFISMDKYQGTINDPISLHKYLYANANPVMYTDPTGYNSYTLAETMETVTIMGILSEIIIPTIGPALEVIAFLTTAIVVADYTVTVIPDIEDTVWGLLNGRTGVGDAAWDIRDDVIFKAESDSNKEADKAEETPEVKYPGNDPAKSPGKDWQWKGKGEQGSRKGNYTNPKTGESLHPDLDHPTEGKGIGPHWDYKSPEGKWYRVFPDGTIKPK